MFKTKIIFFLFISFPILSQEQNYKWEIALPGNVISTPVERKNGDIILICEDRRLYSINNKTGLINWKTTPGGKLSELFLSLDGSIIVRDNASIHSYFSDGSKRWSTNFSGRFDSNMSINTRGDIFVISSNTLFKIDRFGIKSVAINNIKSSRISVLNNSLIVYELNKKLYAVTYSGSKAWSSILQDELVLIKSNNNLLYVVYKTGLVDKYSSDGLLLDSYDTGNNNPISGNINYNNDFLITGDRGTTLIHENKISTFDNIDNGLFYSNGLLIKFKSDWTIHSEYISKNYEYFPSGQNQVIKRTISLSDKRVWNDNKRSEYYKNTILSGIRSTQFELLGVIKENLNSQSLLEDIPNFYEILLLASSYQNINQDVRLEAYKIIGLSKDISFLPYLMADLQNESSYTVLPYIFFALGQLGVDRNGSVINLINSRIDDYFDETLVINALYALYYINVYTNNEFVDIVLDSIDKILDGGYSRNLDNRCYDILKKIK